MNLKVNKTFESFINSFFVKEYGEIFTEYLSKNFDKVQNYSTKTAEFRMGYMSRVTFWAFKTIHVTFWKHNDECVTKDFTLDEKGFKSACRWVDRSRVEYAEKCLKDILC